MEAIIAAIVGIAGGLGAGVAYKTNQIKKSDADAESGAKKALGEAEKKANSLVLEAKESSLKIAEEAKNEELSRRKEIANIERRVLEREESLDKKLEGLEQKSESLRKEEDEITEFKTELKGIRTQQQEKLEKIAGLSSEEAADKLIKMTEREVKDDLVRLVSKLKQDATETAEEQAKQIIVEAMERMASEVTAERTITSVELSSDEMKGRIIGKEGRNIQALERATGVDFMVDDTPGVVILSCFDPVRREVARKTLEKLIKDGRIHPGRVEEVVVKVREELERDIMKIGEAANHELKLRNVPPEITRLMGTLKFRTSYGQNVLKHSVEMAKMAAIIADQIGADPYLTKYAAYLHDIGKALTHEREGKHHHISGEIVREYGLDENLAHAVEAHHDDIDATTPEALIVRVVDALSAGRPGGRGNTHENFVERMKELENIANSFKGIKKAYAISAGREVRIFVRPEEVDDLSAIRLARDIANKVEASLQYPGTIKVNVIRETRAEEYAK